MKKTVEWYQKAAENKDTIAMCLIGMCYEEGDGVTKDLAEAAKWYREAAENGHVEAMFIIGVWYEDYLL